MKRILALCMTLVLLLGMLPMPQAEAASLTLTVKGGWLRLRDEASYNGDTIASYYTGTKVTVLDTKGAWYRVRTPDGRVGYMLGSYLTSSGTGSSGSANQNITAYVFSSNGKGVRLRHGPGTGYGVIRQYPVGTMVKILSWGTYWHYVNIDGEKGYMMSDYLTTRCPTPDPEPDVDVDVDVDVSYTAYVTSSNGKSVRLRHGAGTSYGVIDSYPVGTEVLVHGKSGSWSQITVQGQQGYMMTKYLTKVKPGVSAPSEPDFTAYTAYVTSSNGKGVNLRQGPSTSRASMGQYDVGTAVTVLGVSGSWSYIDVAGVKGYMMSKFLTTKQPSSGGSSSGATGSTYTAYVTSENGKGVYLRKGAGTSYGAYGLYSVGTPVTVLQHNTTWDKVRIGSREGYMMNKFLTTTAPGSKTVSGVMLSDAMPAVGETIWANVTPADANVTYEWMTDNGLLLATTASLTLKADDVGLRIRVRVTGTNGYSGSAVSSFATVQKANAQADKPFSGTASLNFSAIMPGVTLRPSVNVNCSSITYHWYVGGVETSNAAELAVTQAMAGKEIKLVVKPASGSGYTGQVESNVCTVLSTSITTPTDL